MIEQIMNYLRNLSSTLQQGSDDENDENHRDAQEEKEIRLEYPSDVEILTTLSNKRKSNYSIRISKRLFGTPSVSLVWKRRRRLLQDLGHLDRLTTLVIQGTMMGQVISAECLALAVSNQHLRVIQIDAGLIFDEVSSVCAMAEALNNHQHLREVRLTNFLNHVRPIEESSIYLLDPLVQALASIPTLRVLDLVCLATFVKWPKNNLISTSAMRSMLSSLAKLQRLNLTNLSLEDDQFEIIADTNTYRTDMKEMILNANENTQHGLRRIVDALDSMPSLIRLEVANHVKLDTDTEAALLGHLQKYACRLQYFMCTYSIRQDRRRIDMYLQLHRLDLIHRYYPPTTSPEGCVQVLSETNNNLDCLYSLLRENPNLCNVTMNGMKSSTLTTSSLQWFGRFCIALAILCMARCLPQLMIESDDYGSLLRNDDSFGSTLFTYNVPEMTSLHDDASLRTGRKACKQHVSSEDTMVRHPP